MARITAFRRRLLLVLGGVCGGSVPFMVIPAYARDGFGNAATALPVLLWLALPLIVAVGTIALVVAFHGLARLRSPTPPPPCDLDNWPNTSRWA